MEKEKYDDEQDKLHDSLKDIKAQPYPEEGFPQDDPGEGYPRDDSE